jgi:methylmalonyl-CoA mutase N-terminal domain/subunit
MDRIDGMGGMIDAIEAGYPQREIQEASYREQRAIEKEDQVVVGVNRFVTAEPSRPEILRIGPEVENAQVRSLRALRRERNEVSVSRALRDLCRAAGTDQNLMPHLIHAVREYATVGEICSALKEVFGVYQEPLF